VPARSYDRTSAIAGGIFVVLGALFLVERLGILVLAGRYVWPVLLIILGVVVLIGESSRRRYLRRDDLTQ
jgi:uncharacterized membrane protein